MFSCWNLLSTSISCSHNQILHKPSNKKTERQTCIHIEIQREARQREIKKERILSLQPPNAADRAQVLAKEVRLPNGPSTPLDDQDVQIVRFCSQNRYNYKV